MLNEDREVKIRLFTPGFNEIPFLNAPVMKCHDCKNEITTGKVYKDDFFKCITCFEKNNILTNFQPCEVYSRIVGYIRPLTQWNAGKKSEFADRIEFKEHLNSPMEVMEEK